ncbi:MAG: GNAT family N-acetyltransferase [Oscillospiraceae bacterium]|nr:GNAT family N-acetyltransferase [Oscillospiraceae bacterium]
MEPIVRRGQDAVEIIHQKLQLYNSRFLTDFSELCFCIEAQDQILAGICATRELDCVTVDYLFVEESYRGCGYGSRLLARIEQAARAEGARRILLNTFSFQAPGFYQKHGYRLLAKLEPALGTYGQYFFWKSLDLEQAPSGILTVL